MDHIGLLKMIKVMRFTIFILFISLSQAFAVNSYSQQTKLTLNMRGVRVEEVIDEIEKSTEFFFLYNKGLVDVNRKVDIRVEGESIVEVLDKIFEDTDISYSIKDRQILLMNDRVPETINQLQKVVSGKVTDSSGTPLPGVTVVVKGTTQGTITDATGNYSLSNVSGNVTLVFSFVGMKSLEIPIEGKNRINIAMQEETIGIEEVVAVGYGTIRKSDVTGSVTSVDSEELMKRNPINLEQGLQGMAAGVQVVRTSGDPEGGTTIRIRGTATINNSAEPLFVVDGIMVGTSANFLNPNDIESIEVLKDASATAIYGSRGANGVIMITTKKGEKGLSRLNFTANFGVQTLSKKIDVTHAEEFAIAANQTTTNDGTPANPVWGNPAALHHIDWQDEMSRNSLSQSYHLSTSSGSDKTQSMLSVSFVNNDGIIIESNYNRLTARANVNHEVKDFIRTGLNLTYMHSEREGGGNMLDYAQLIPTMDTLAVDGSGTLVHVPVQYPDGTWGHFPREGNGYNPQSMDNPVAAAKTADAKTYKNRVLASAFIEIDLFKGLTFKSVGGVNYSGGSYYSYSMAHNRTYYGNDTDDFTTNHWSNTELLLENYFTYDRTFHTDHHLTLLAGHSVSKDEPRDISANSSIFPSTSIRRVELTSDPNTINASGGLGIKTRQQSFFGRVMYSFAERYLLTATIRHDGSSNFGSGNRYGTFPSASVAWRASEEEFIKKLGVFSNLKLRVGWGQTGNAGNTTNLSVDQLSSDRIAYYFYDPVPGTFTIAPGITQATEIDTNLKWEKNEQKNIGLDVGLLNNTLNVTMDYFRRDSKDLLLYRTLRPSTGFENIYTNAGHIRNTGFEFEIGYRKRWGNWDLGVKVNGTHIKNKAIDIGDDIYSSEDVDDGANWGNYSITRNGHPVGSYFGWRVDRIYQTQAELDADNVSALAAGASDGYYQSPETKPGDYRYKDLDGNGYIDDQDREIIGDGYPKLTYGLNISLGWKNWDFSMYMYGIAGQDILSYSYRELTNIGLAGGGGYHAVLDKYAKGAWNGAGSTNKYPRLTRQDANHNSQVSDAFILDGDFLKMQNIQVGYTFPREWLNPVKLESARVFFSVENLFTLTDYEVGDPEVGSSNVLQTGFDGGRYPFPRTYTFGLSLGF